MPSCVSHIHSGIQAPLWKQKPSHASHVLKPYANGPEVNLQLCPLQRGLMSPGNHLMKLLQAGRARLQTQRFIGTALQTSAATLFSK